MASRVVPPETILLPISNGDWLLVRKRLNAGEQRKLLKMLYGSTADGAKRLDLSMVGVATITAFLLDWSLTDPQGQQIVIVGKSPDALIAALDSIDIDSFDEIYGAIDQHATAIASARAEEKKLQDGNKTSSPTSISPPVADGVMSGSLN